MSGFESSAFLRRLRNNTEQARPVPGQIRISRAASDEAGHAAQTKNSSAPIDINVDSSNQVVFPSAPSLSAQPPVQNGKYVSTYKLGQFEKLLAQENVDLSALRRLAWNGVPAKYRADVWQMLLGYLPTNKDRRTPALSRKRKEYSELVYTYFTVTLSDRTKQDEDNHAQILIDLPRTSPNVAFFQQSLVQKAMERVLYIWSIRHPASGYVQGMNDLLTPLLLVSLQPFVEDPLRCDVAALEPGTMVSSTSLNNFLLTVIVKLAGPMRKTVAKMVIFLCMFGCKLCPPFDMPASALISVQANVEADAYWCLTKMLDNIQDHYTFGQPGLQRMTLRLEDLVHRLDNELFTHFQAQGVMFQFFTTRWMNCYLLRELPLRSILRLWDTYIAEEIGGFENFHVYVCVVLLKTFKDTVIKMEFQDILLFLQNLPTLDWGEEEVEPILSQAFILSTLFENSPSHLS